MIKLFSDHLSVFMSSVLHYHHGDNSNHHEGFNLDHRVGDDSDHRVGDDSDSPFYMTILMKV